jgi:hypothetical protein
MRTGLQRLASSLARVVPRSRHTLLSACNMSSEAVKGPVACDIAKLKLAHTDVDASPMKQFAAW